MKKFLLYFFGICCVISSVVGFIQYGILNGVTCLIIGVVLISLARQPSDPAAVDSPEAVQPQSQPQRSGRLRSRQTILKKISFCDPPFDSGYAARLERYLYNDEPAYYVYVNDYIVGNVPKGFIPYLEKNAGRPYIVEYFKVHGGGKKKYYGAEMRKYTDIEGEE